MNLKRFEYNAITIDVLVLDKNESTSYVVNSVETNSHDL